MKLSGRKLGLAVCIFCLSVSALIAAAPPAESGEGERLLAAGVAQLAASDLDAARGSLEGALAAFRAVHDRHGEARTLKELGSLRYTKGETVQAAELAREALGIAREVQDQDLEARLLNNLGLALQTTDGDKEASDLFRQSAELARKEKNEIVETIALGNLADIDLARGDARQSLLRLERAAEMARRLGNPSLAARVLTSLARTYEALGDLKESAKLWEEAVPHASASGLRQGEATVLNGLALALFNAGQVEKAVEAGQRALAIAREIADKETEAASLQILALAKEEGSAQEASGSDVTRLKQDFDAALARQDRGAAARLSHDLGLALLGQLKVEEAAEAFDRSLVLSGEAQDPVSRLLALQALQKIQGYIAKHPRYGEYLNHMLQAARELGLRELACVLLVQLGLDHLTAQRPREAVEALKEALTRVNEEGLALPDELSARELTMQALGDLAFAEFLLGHWSASAGYAERLLAEARSAGDGLRVGDAFLALARVENEREDLSKAIKLLEQGLGAYEKISGAEDRVANACSLLGNARFNVGDGAGALTAFNRMAEASRKAKDRKTEVLALQYQAGTLLIQERPEAAEKVLKESLVLGRSLDDPTLRVNSLVQLGMLAAYDNDYHRAVEYWRQALEVVRRGPASALTAVLDRRLEVNGLTLLARGYANLGEDAKALELAAAALSIAEVGEFPERPLALDTRAHVHFRAGRLPEAEADAREALDLFETYRAKVSQDELARAGAQDVYSSLHELLQKVLVRQGKSGEALVVAERGRARALAEGLGGAEDLPPSLESLRELARGNGLTFVEYSILHDPKRFLVPGRFEGTQASFEDELYVWVVRPTGEVDFRTVDLKSQQSGSMGEALAERVKRLLLLLEEREGSVAETRALLRGLHDLLIVPVADLLPTDPERPVVFVPQGPLFRLPFNALLDPAGRFLVERHTVLTVPSATSLAVLRRAGEKSGWTGPGVLVVGNPDNPQIGRLRGAEREASDIAKIFGARPLLGRQATEAAVSSALPRARLVHVASHGLLERRETPNLPGALALTPSAVGEDGLLTSGEVRALKLQADLVVLSACQTGRGRISGEGVFGLSRSFLAAGAAGVVMSLWRIDDEATSSLMVELHRQLKRSGDPARALRAAALKALKRGESPRSWGAFLYTGTPGPQFTRARFPPPLR